jgi:hypothetical protein
MHKTRTRDYRWTKTWVFNTRVCPDSTERHGLTRRVIGAIQSVARLQDI